MSKQYIVIDFETYYDDEYSLRHMTPVEYVMHPRFECIGASVLVGDTGEAVFLEEHELAEYLDTLDRNKTVVVSHNALFDMCILVWRFGFTPALMIDTMSMARALLYHKTGGVSLARIARELTLPAKTDTIKKVTGMGKAAIKAAGLWGPYTEYANNDADICRQIFMRLRRDFPKEEFKINDMVIRCAVIPRFKLDATLLAEHLNDVITAKENLLAEAGMTTRDELLSNEKFANALRRFGVEPPMKISLRTGLETYAFAKTDQAMADLEDHEDPRVQALVAARLGIKSTQEETRSRRFLSIAMLDWGPSKIRKGQGWMPIPLCYSGAHTHRLSGDWSLNLQNLPRGGKLRAALTAPSKCSVVACDASQIEARIVAWLAGQGDLLDGFREGRDIYSEFASSIFGRPVNKKDNPEDRFVGKQCLAAGTLVVTDKGNIPIEQVTENHKVWDGEEWVCHKGSVFSGWKQTVQLCGVSLTPDHLVLCGTEWREAQYLVAHESIRCLALGTAAVNFKLVGMSKENAAVSQASLSGVAVRPMSTPSTYKILKTLSLLAVMIVPKKQQLRKNIGCTQKLCQTTGTDHVYSTGCPQQLIDVTIQMVLDLFTMGKEVLPSSVSGGVIVQRFCCMFRRLLGGTIQNSKWTALMSTATMSPETYGLSADQKTYPTNDRLQTLSGASESLRPKSPVYDILSAGPRHRFTIITDSGPLIVHNCILGLGYGMGGPKFDLTISTQSRLQLGKQIDLGMMEASRIVGVYRNKYSAISKYWAGAGNLLPAMTNPNADIEFGPVRVQHMSVLLPNGLRLRYHNLRQVPGDKGSQWVYDFGGQQKKLYGGKLTENIVQALARIVVMRAAARMEKIYPSIPLALQVHDELIYIVPDVIAQDFATTLRYEMSQEVSPFLGLPLAAEYKIGKSYGDTK
jgi:hypothetical protein